MPWDGSRLLYAAGLTALIFLLIPLTHYFGQSSPERLLTLHPAETVTPPPPPFTPEPAPAPPTPRETVQLEMPAQAPRVEPMNLQPTMKLSLPSFGDGPAWAFSVIEPGRGDAVYSLADMDEPPRALVQIPPMYPPSARQAGLEGEVRLVFVITRDGAVTDVEVLSSTPGTLFNAAAVQAVRQWRFEPATRGGEPAAVRVEVPVQFKLER